MTDNSQSDISLTHWSQKLFKHTHVQVTLACIGYFQAS